MPIPSFNDFGILPTGLRNCTLDEAQLFCSWNEHRSLVWKQFSGFIDWAVSMPKPAILYVDGSYVTDKALPSDIDVAVDVSECDVFGQNQWFGECARRHSEFKGNFATDFYPYVTGNGNDFLEFFQYLKISEAFERGVADGTKKGVLRIVL